jgi:hypothetical protein
MSGRTTRPHDQLRSEIEHNAAALERGCRRQWGVSGVMFRTAKYVFYIATLAMTTYLVEYQSVEPVIAMAFAALLITGPEGLEAWLIRTGQLQSPQQADTPSKAGESDDAERVR